jgi:hypothetical protein
VTSSPTPNDDFSGSSAARIVERVLTERFEQGCWLPASEARAFAVTDAETEDLTEAWATVDADADAQLRQLEARTEPGLPQDLAPDDTADRYIIITQQCDLIRQPALEPTLEAVTAYWESDPGTIGNRRNLKSWREIVVAEVDKDDTPGALIASSRRRSLIDKRALLVFPARQSLPDDMDFRRRFAFWAGARYYRRPVPEDLARRIERPLNDAVKKKAAVRAVAETFNMFVLVDGENGPRLYGIHEREEDRDMLERALAEVCEDVAFEGFTAEDCEAMPIGQAPMSWAWGANAYHLSFESYSGPGDPISPALEVSPEEERSSERPN